MDDYEFAYQHWLKVAREEFTRDQIVQTAADNRDLANPVWYAMQDELQRRDELEKKRMFRRELREAEKGLSPYGLETDKPKKRLPKYLKYKGKKRLKMTV